MIVDILGVVAEDHLLFSSLTVPLSVLQAVGVGRLTGMVDRDKLVKPKD